MIRFRDRGARGRHFGARVDARHSFSFGDYTDPANMGFRALRVLNEDRIIPGGGFAEHGHADMEILTLVLDGTLAHHDSLGNAVRIEAGEVQRMTAGTGVRHSERNPDPDRRAHIVQIWIFPETDGLAPGYEQKAFAPTEHRNTFRPIANRDGHAGALTLHQDAALALARMDEGARIEQALSPARGYWVQVLRGIVALGGTEMREGDGAALSAESTLRLEAETQAEVLLIDLA
ncbi:pirin family protein [Novosphingobium sp. 1949]|uniref:Pirin family protein n=1 Tax=Novosphingobium organovorum TaxID=2930092 RepID=A0ABT0BES1_9SPHN|nr:pirin family protein [Novosphingobium organovorum]MCJ2183565.1 pirin family protein [Novosphingobium organovorum]